MSEINSKHPKSLKGATNFGTTKILHARAVQVFPLSWLAQSPVQYSQICPLMQLHGWSLLQ